MLKVLLFSILLSPPQYSFDGDFTQGGLVEGKVSSWIDVYHNGKKLKKYDDRVFFGFNRDDKSETTIVLKENGKTIQTLDYEVIQREYDIQHINGLPKSKVNPPKMDWDRIKAENRKIGGARLDTISDCPELNFIMPATGITSGVFGSQRILNGEPKRPHYGIDIAAPLGSPVISPAWGKVNLIHDDMFYTGGTIAIDHGCGLVSVFSHMETIGVEVGDEVQQGDEIGTVGSTGRSTGPHLDWRVNLHKVRLDPALLLE